jgi:hypothetical protein
MSADSAASAPAVAATPAPTLPEHAKFLIGTWRGTGKGYFPTMPNFAYVSLSFIEVGSFRHH